MSKKTSMANFVIVSLYVDDLLFTGNDKSLCDDFTNSMKKELEMSDMGLIHYFLGIEVNQNEGEIVISQQKYAHDLLNKFRNGKCFTMQHSHGCKFEIVQGCYWRSSRSPSLYRSLVGSLGLV